MEMFMVGGYVRDELLGVPSKDIDFTVVLGVDDLLDSATCISPFRIMVHKLESLGFTIFLETPEFLTVRAKFPKGHEHAKLTADFVLARKESDYTDGRRPDVVEPGTLLMDLQRRDFTFNAIAKAADGTLIDPFNGQRDIKARIIRAVGDPRERFEEDALRIVRAMRFSVTKGFEIDPRTRRAMNDLSHTVAGVSAERVREELTKMFNADPFKTIVVLGIFNMFHIIFDMGINFQPTLRDRIR